jgi:subtilisin family serine protease/subtilisin-like proprotein convertase family protein
MRRRPAFWIILGILVVISGAALLWMQSNVSSLKSKIGEQSNLRSSSPVVSGPVSRASATNLPSRETVAEAERILAARAKASPKFKNRLSNTEATVGQLTRKDHAILLENALFDTEKPIAPKFPAQLKSQGDPGSYIVQSKTAIDNSFRDALTQAGAAIVPNLYIPNNALMVRASKEVAMQLGALPQTQTVLPFEPYYKLQTGLLDEAVNQRDLPEGSILNVLLFADAKESTIGDLKKLGAQVLADERSYFGHIVKVLAPENWVEVARMPGVQIVEMSHSRVAANDLSRVRIGVATNTITDTTGNYLGLDGTGVLVAVNDSGVDLNHPDLASRVTGDFGSSLVDSNGHGTHVAGIIASSGEQSPSVTNASGSLNPGTNHQYRGIAPKANIFSMAVNTGFSAPGSPFFGGQTSDVHLQESAARTNALISNNSWHYFGDSTYDLGAASYDAAVRDSLPGATGSQPIIYVFSAGNSGNGDDTGQSGSPDSIESPGTAKNVITVGSIEQYRLITNQVVVTNTVMSESNTLIQVTTTNTPWLGLTDSSNQVASFSSRGNVGFGTEGDFGRFKPDVVAPGTFVVSTTWRPDWDQASYYDPTNYSFELFQGTAVTNDLSQHSIFIPANTVAFRISTIPSGLSIYVRQAGSPTTNTYDVLRTNNVTVGPAPTDDLPLGTFVDTDWFYAIGSHTNQPVDYLAIVELITTNNVGNYFQVLSNLNDNCGPYYRYESGTSMSAAGVSGTLALIQQYFAQHNNVTNSPALMKALVINGARTINGVYDFQVTNALNLQGWGLINLPNSLPTNTATLPTQTAPMLVFDQNPTNALATGDSRTYHIQVADDAKSGPLRVTLAWTDPPGNPAAGVKLVNDLDLIVTNLDNPTNPVIYLGNDIPGGSTFSVQWDTNSPPNIDVVNNVENVYLFPGSGTNFYVTVSAKRVNVNAVTAQTNEVVQDYALVISSGNGKIADALQLKDPATNVSARVPQLTVLSNQFDNIPGEGGGSLEGQRVGASIQIPGTNTLPLILGSITSNGAPVSGQITIGTTNGWHFYTVTNTSGFTNAAFLIDVAIPTADSPVATNTTRSQADLDLYVSTDPAITNLDPAAIDASAKSLSRFGEETVVLSNAVPGLYYVGVKSEDQEAGQYSFIALFSQNPFSQEDPNGQLVPGINVPAIIPDGTTERPGVAEIYAIAVRSMRIKRVIVTNVLTHELTGDLFSTLRHTVLQSVVNNHSGSGGVTNQWYIYDDSSRHDIVGSQHTDPPGDLSIFNALPAVGQWHFSMQDNAPTHTGTNVDFKMYIERQKDPLEGELIDLAPGGCDDEYLYVPPEATNLTVIATITTGTGPVSMEVCPLGASGNDCVTTLLGVSPQTNSITIDKSSDPPLNAGTYVIHICNNSSGNVQVYLQAFLFRDVRGVIPSKFAGGGQTILDDAVTYSKIHVPPPSLIDPLKIVSTEVGVRIDHPRVSDLVLRLIGPDGTRMLLQENRGGLSTNGMGANQFSTNIVPVNANGGSDAQTNIIDLAVVPTSFRVDWNFFSIPDFMHIYYGGNLIFDSGLVSGQGTFMTNLPGPANQVTIVMNEGGNTNNMTTAWQYNVTAIEANYTYLTFTEDTNKTITPIKFAIPPFVNAQGVGTSTLISDFESATPGDYSAPQIVDGWNVLSSAPVTVTNDPAGAHTGAQYLNLNQGHIGRTLPTTAGLDYVLAFSAKQPACPQYPNFNSTNGLNLVGSAVTTGGILQLTPAVSSQTGDAWLTNKQPVAAGFDTTFHFRIGGPYGNIFGGEAGGDGLTFSVQNVGPTDLQWAMGGTNNYTGVFFNTFWNWPGCTCPDVSDNSIGILTNQNYVAQVDLNPLNINMSDGNSHLARIRYDGAVMSVWIDGLLVLNNVPVPAGLGTATDSCGQGWVGFTAGTGGAYETHEISDWSFCPAASASPATIYIPGQTTNVITAGTTWATNTFAFTANQSGTPIEIATNVCSTPVLLDDFVLSEAGSSPLYVLPEDPYGISLLTGKSAIGDWQLEIWDNRAGPPIPDTNNPPRLLSWDLSFVFATARPVPIPLVHDETETNIVRPGGFQYYVIKVPSWASFATNSLLSVAPIPPPGVNVWFNQNGPPIGNTAAGDIQLPIGPGGGTFATLTTNAVPPPLPPLIPGSTYYIGIQNPGTVSETVSFKVDFDVTPLTNGIPVASPADPVVPRFFSYNVTNGETGIAVLLTNLTGNVDLVARKTPFPDLTTYDYGSFNPRTNDEDILIYPNSDPVVLSPGNWYFGVFDRDPTNVNYDIVVIDVPYIITLFNALPYTNSNSGGLFNIDYYRFTVAPNAVRAQFELLNPSGDVTLVVRKGMPPADLSNYAYISANPGASPELVGVFNSSTPVPLSQGDWLISAVNVSGGPVTYTALATEWPLTGRPIIITNEFATITNGALNFCLTWTSLPGVHYWVGGMTNITQGSWDNLSGTVTASGYLTTWCLPIPSLHTFFRVFEGFAPGPPVTPLIAPPPGPKPGITASGNGAFTLNWSGPTNASFKVQWTSSLQSPNWQTFLGGITSSNGTYTFKDQSAAGAAARFYRIVPQ